MTLPEWLKVTFNNKRSHLRIRSHFVADPHSGLNDATTAIFQSSLEARGSVIQVRSGGRPRDRVKRSGQTIILFPSSAYIGLWRRAEGRRMSSRLAGGGGAALHPAVTVDGARGE
ncbi:hypothetical protein CEXT_442781 [Caerostris extrusa]|uniref:Uncharacterized protein n=1 Tax=Caerostris extrusa TaxID=172846 RepID=A0AAV4PDA9_CAEEX|nr:hypothetical protein CEXT_442781 [Caerostris extrusa]